jgi:octaprenyl-diphosphate synthase
MNRLEQISSPIAPHMEEFNRRLKGSLHTDTFLLDRVIRYILKRKGKQMRPMFVFLSAMLNGGINDSAYHAATFIELMHTATLVHDDVVDGADRRRGFFSVNALWKNKVAVLVGDYLLSRGLLLSLETREFEQLRIVSQAVKEMSEGELLQIEKSRSLNISEEVYFRIIRKKTASLIAACCAAGASAAGAPEEAVARMRDFGERVGMAFQIKDDLMDFDTGSSSGKPGGLDIKEQKISLPVIHMLSHCTLLERRRILRLIRGHQNDPERISRVMDKVRNSEGIAYAEKVMLEFRDQALDTLKSFPEGDARRSLEALVLFTTDRKH